MVQPPALNKPGREGYQNPPGPANAWLYVIAYLRLPMIRRIDMNKLMNAT